jgi:hypothetical protein
LFQIGVKLKTVQQEVSTSEMADESESELADEPESDRGESVFEKGAQTIDLKGPIPGSNHAAIKNWIVAEQAAFQDKKMWDPETQITVSEVAVSFIISSECSSSDIVDLAHCHSAIIAETMGFGDSETFPRVTRLHI